MLSVDKPPSPSCDFNQLKHERGELYTALLYPPTRDRNSFFDISLNVRVAHADPEILIPAHCERDSLPFILHDVMDSTLWQTCSHAKIRICVNGLHDPEAIATMEVAQRYANRYSRIEVTSIFQRSKNEAWKALVTTSSPEASNLVFLDADVRLGSSTLDQLIDRLECESNCDLVAAGLLALDCSRADSGFYQRLRSCYMNSFEKREGGYNRGSLTGACYAIRRSVARGLVNEFPTDPIIADDKYLALKLAGKVEIMPQAHVYCKTPSLRGHLSQVCRSKESDARLAKNYPELFARARTFHQQSFEGALQSLRECSAKEFLAYAVTFMVGPMASVYRAWRKLIKADLWPSLPETKPQR